VRLACALALAPGLTPFGDDTFFRFTALDLGHGEGYVGSFGVFIYGRKLPTAEHPPLYPLALSVLVRLGAESLDAQRLVGVFAGTTTVLACGLIAARLAGPRAGIAAAALCAVYPAYIAADGAIMSESLFGALVACCLLLALALLERPSTLGTAGLGVLVALAALTRSEGLLLIPLLAAPLMACAPGRRVRLAATLLAAAALALSPWVIRNWHAFGQPVFTTNEGTTLAGANCPKTYYDTPSIGAFATSCLGKLGIAPSANAAVSNSRLRAAGMRYLRAHRTRAVLVAGVRVLRTWGFYAIDHQTRPSGRNRTLQTTGVVIYYAVLLVGLSGAIVLWRRGMRAQLAIVLAPVVLATVTAVLTYGFVRLRHPAEASLIVLAGISLASLRRRPAGWISTSPPCA
jgi:Gpi18-like mannosyltransferase